MKKSRTINGGYIGILMLLLGVALMAFLIIRTDLFTGGKDGNDKNMIEQSKADIDQAKAVKEMMEKNTRLVTED